MSGVVLLSSVPGSVVSHPLVWRGSLHPDHLKVLAMENGSYSEDIAVINSAYKFLAIVANRGSCAVEA